MLNKWFNTNFNICVINIDILVHIIVNVFHYEFVYVPYDLFCFFIAEGNYIPRC